MRRRIVVIVAALTATAVACSDDAPRTQTAYCDAARANAAALTNPQIRTTADLDAIAALYAEMHGKAPLAVEPEWAVMESLMRAALDVDRTKTSDVASVARSARLARTASDRVITYTQQMCGVLIGDTPVGSTPIQVPSGTGAITENTFDFSDETVADFDPQDTLPADETIPADETLPTDQNQSG